MAVTGVTGGTGAGTAESPGIAAAANDQLSKDTFLKLLVAQIRNQNPLNPADGVQFVTQLAQFSELEQVMAIRQDLEHPQQTTGFAGTGAVEGGESEHTGN